MDDLATLQIRVLSDQVDTARTRLDALEGSGKKAEKTILGMSKSAVAGMAAFTGISVSLAAVGSVVASSTKAWMAYDVAMKEASSITNMSAKEFDTMRESVLRLSVTLGVDATTSAKALYQALSAGVSKGDALAFLEVAGKTAIAGVTDIKSAVDVLTNVMNAYKMPTTEASNVSDKLFATVKGGKTTMVELSENMSKGSVTAAALGVSIDELLASVATLTLQGTPTAEAFTQIKAQMVAMMNASPEMEGALDRLGYSSSRAAINPHFPALRSGPLALSGASRTKQIPSSQRQPGQAHGARHGRGHGQWNRPETQDHKTQDARE